MKVSYQLSGTHKTGTERDTRLTFNLMRSLVCFLFMLSPLFAQMGDNILIVVNENSPDSRAIGRYYAEKRNVPQTNICLIRTSESDTISRGVFDRELVRPIANHLRSHGLQDQILYIVTTRGIPLVVEGNSGASGDMASVDSDLTLLYRYMLYGSYPVYGRTENPYFFVNFKPDTFRPFVRRDYDIYLVTRLTGPSAIDAVLLVDRALSARPAGGFYFDLVSEQQSLQAEWVLQAVKTLEQAELSVMLDRTTKSLNNLKAVQGYVKQSEFAPGKDSSIVDIQWNPGAVAMLFSRSDTRISPASSLEEVKINPSDIISRYVESGLTGLGSYVADPLLDGYIRPQILFPAYVAGHNLAEAFYAASLYTGWRQVIVGDPLASPYFSVSTGKRDAMTAEYRTGDDAETGLPQYFSQRRQLYLTQKYTTSTASIVLLLKAEAAAYRGDHTSAIALLDGSIEKDPSIVEAHLLKGDLLENAGDFDGSFEQYSLAVDLGNAERETYLKLVRLALEKIDSPEKAFPYAQWLYRRYGKTDSDIAELYYEIQHMLRPVENQTASMPEDAPSVSVEDTEAVPSGDRVYPARVITQAPIEYPFGAKLSGVEGKVVINLHLDEMGQVMKAEIVNGNRQLAEAALDSVRQWRFEPRLENGRPVECNFTVSINFRLKKN